MKLSDKQQLLSYFQDKRNKDLITVCNITGMSFVISAPILHNVKGFCYSGLSPLANKEAAISLGECSYSEGHYDLAPTVLAGAILSLFSAYKLRHDHLSAVEANMLLSQLPLFQLSQTLRFLAALSSHEIKRIPHISLDEAEASTLKHWLLDCHAALDVTNYEPVEQKQPKLTKAFSDESITSELRKQARTLLKTLKDSSILPIRLQTIISMSIQKNNLAMISPELRKNIIAALTKLGTLDCLSLASIFEEAAKNKTNQEAIISKALDEAPSIFSETSNAPSLKLTLAEVLAQKLAPKQEPIIDYAAMVQELASEEDQEEDEDETEAIDEEFLADHDTEEAIMAESNIKELDLDSDDYDSNKDNQDYADDESLDLDIDSLDLEATED